MDAAQLLQTIESATRACAGITFPSEADRNIVITAARELMFALRPPAFTVLEIAKWPAGHAALRTAIELKIFDDWPKGVVKNSSEIAKQSCAEELLIIRIMRALASIGIFKEQGERQYAHSRLSGTLLSLGFRSVIFAMHVAPFLMRAMMLTKIRSFEAAWAMPRLPEYLEFIQYRNPIGQEGVGQSYNYGFDTTVGAPEWAERQPLEGKKPMNMLQHSIAASAHVENRLLLKTLDALIPKDNTTVSPAALEKSPDTHQVLLVSVCTGTHIHLLDQLRIYRPKLEGRIIAQDMPLSKQHKALRVEKMTLDPSCQPQTIEGDRPLTTDIKHLLTHHVFSGASVYLFLCVLHKLTDSVCRQVLNNTIPALAPGFSRIVIVDKVLPNTNATAFSALSDLTMMAYRQMERTERQWREMLEGVGLHVDSIEPPRPGGLANNSVITARLIVREGEQK